MIEQKSDLMFWGEAETADEAMEALTRLRPRLLERTPEYRFSRFCERAEASEHSGKLMATFFERRIGTMTPLDDLLRDIVMRYRGEASGEIATYIPELGFANPDWFGMCIVTTDGAVYEAGDSRQEFTIQSISKPFVYGLALEKFGQDAVRQRVGVEPSGDAFNSISLQSGSGRPLNPMINAGAIAVSHLIYSGAKSNVVGQLLEWFEGFAARPLVIDEKVYQSESATGHRNRAIAHLLRNFGVVSDPVEQGLDLYFRQCSILTTCHDLAVMAATLANNGINPISQQPAMSPEYVEDVLSVMTTCGMYNYAGQWLYDVGVPAKSGVSGGIMLVLPGRLGIGTFSPKLDPQGNSVRGILACRELSEHFGLHLFRPHRTSSAVVRNQMTLEHRRSSRVRPADDLQRLRSLCASVYLMELQGDLHFTSMEVIQRQVWERLPTMRILLLELSRVDSMDRPALDCIERMVARLESNGVMVALAGVARDSGIRRQLLLHNDRKLMFSDLDGALEASEEFLLHDLPMGKKTQPEEREALQLHQLDVAQGLDSHDQEYLERLLSKRTFRAGQCICRKGDAAGEIYFLIKGTVSVRLSNGAQTVQRLAVFDAGSVFGEIATIDRGPRSADVWADTLVECFCLSVEDLDRLATERPGLKIHILQYLMRILTARLRRCNDLIGQLAG